MVGRKLAAPLKAAQAKKRFGITEPKNYRFELKQSIDERLPVRNHRNKNQRPPPNASIPAAGPAYDRRPSTSLMIVVSTCQIWLIASARTPMVGLWEWTRVHGRRQSIFVTGEDT
jgi:hypothetical protein